MVAVFTVKVLDMQRHARVLREGLEPFFEQLGVEFPQLVPCELHFPNQVGPVGKVEGDARQGLVHGDERIAVSGDSLALAQGLGHGLAEDDPGILGGVMEVDVQVAFGAERDVDQAVTRQLLQHVVEKTDPGVDIIAPAAVEINGGGNLRLRRVARDACLAHVWHSRTLPRWRNGALVAGSSADGQGCRAHRVPAANASVHAAA